MSTFYGVYAMKRVVAFAVLALAVVLGLYLTYPSLHGQSGPETHPPKAPDHSTDILKNMTEIDLDNSSERPRSVIVISFKGIRTIAGKQFFDVVTPQYAFNKSDIEEKRMLIDASRVIAIVLKDSKKKEDGKKK
jgi:hypothetical protein